MNIDPKARAEELSLLQWIALANFIAPLPRPDTPLTNEERFPVVDKNDRILRYATRAHVHGNNLRHRAVHIFIFNHAGEVYLQQRSRWKDRHPLKWDSSASGHVTAGETYDETARRELKEELSLDVPLEGISKLPASACTDHEFIALYRGVASGDLAPNKSEIEQGAFLPPAIVDGWTSARPEDFAPGFPAKNAPRPPAIYRPPRNFLRGKRRTIVRLNFRAARLAACFPPWTLSLNIFVTTRSPRRKWT